jgi:hypothetical protein
MMTNIDCITSENTYESRSEARSTGWSVGDFVELAHDLTLPPSLNLTIPAGEFGRIIDIDDENGDLVIFVCRWFEELSHRQNIICMTAEQAAVMLA